MFVPFFGVFVDLRADFVTFRLQFVRIRLPFFGVGGPFLERRLGLGCVRIASVGGDVEAVRQALGQQLAIFLGLVVGKDVGAFGDVVVGFDLILQRLVVSAMAEHGDASQHGGDDGHRQRHPTIEGIVGGVLCVFGFFEMMFGSVRHNRCPWPEIEETRQERSFVYGVDAKRHR